MNVGVAEDTDLDWVTFSEDDHEIKCERRCRECPNVAAVKMIWHRHCPCPRARFYCLTCYEHLRSRPGEVVCYCYSCGYILTATATPLGKRS